MAALMHFDLDPCALGFDGYDLWLLPRAARALESMLSLKAYVLSIAHFLLAGYSVFTVGLVPGMAYTLLTHASCIR